MNTNFDQFYKGPAPLHRHAGNEEDLETAFPAALFDECVIWVNHSLLGWVLYVSTGGEWKALSNPRTPDSRRWSFSDFHNTNTAADAAILVNEPNIFRVAFGGGAVPVSTNNTFGNVRISSGAGANSGLGFRNLAATGGIVGRTGMGFACMLGFTPSLDDRVVRLGFLDNLAVPAITDEPNNGAYFEMVGGQIEAVCAANVATGGSRTKIGPTGGFVPDLTNFSDDNIYLFTAAYIATNQVRFCIRKTADLGTRLFDFTISTNVSNAAPGFGCGVIAFKTTAGPQNICVLDYLGWGPRIPVEFA